MNAQLRLLVGVLFLVLGTALAGCRTKEPSPPENLDPNRTALGDNQLSGPYTHDNLTIFLIHGEDRLKDRKYVMLAEALEKKQFVIHETQNVNELTMENLSSEEVLILSGDILKGGQQDRIAQYDQFVPPKSGKLPLTVFCVEHTAGRWMRAMTEEDKTFTASPGQLCSNELRLASRFNGKQGEVWTGVANSQKNLSHNARVDVKAKESDSSLALSLQSKEVKAATEKYIAKIAPLAQDKSDVIGYAFAINGKVYLADVYGSPGLFQKVWPRLIKATAIEAFADLQKDKTFPEVTAAMVKNFVEEASKGKTESKEVTKGIRQLTNPSANAVCIETKAGQVGEKTDVGASIRKSYLAR